MYRERPAALFVKYALPQMIGLLLNSAYLIVDGMFIGNRLGRDAMAAAAVAVPVVEILIALSLTVSVGAGIVISSAFGEGKPEKATEAFNLSLVIAVAASAAIALLGNVYLGETAVLLGATPDILEDATAYMWYIATGSPFLVLSFAFSSYARADNRPKLAMWALVIGAVSNILLDYVFLYPLDMGIAGAALATALATALGPIFSVLILLPHFLRGKGQLRFRRPPASPRLALSILRLGAPAFVMEFSIGIVTLFHNIAITRNGFGEVGLAAYLTIGYIALLILTLFLGVAQGVQPIMSYFHGAGEHARNRELLAFLLKASLALGVAAYACVPLFAERFIAVFTPGDADLIAFTFDKAVVYFAGFMFAGVTILVVTYFQSVRKVGTALLLAMARSVFLPPAFLFVLPTVFGSEGIWSALTAAEAAAFLAALLLYAGARGEARGERDGVLENG